MATRRAGLVLIAIIILAAVPVMAQNQGFLGPPGSGLPPFASPMSMIGPAPVQGYSLYPGTGIPSGPGACGPRVCMPSRRPFCSLEPSVSVGYLIKDRGLGLLFDSNDGVGIAGIANFRQDFTMRGIWLELMVPVALSDGLGIALGGAHLFPFQDRSREVYNTGVLAAMRNWATDTQWWNLQVAGTYQVFPSVTAVAGFRWDSFMANFTDSQDIIGIAGLNTDRADVTFSGYIPFFGLLFQTSVSYGSVLTAGVTGFPAMWASFDYKETFGGAGTRFEASGATAAGHFIEAFGEYMLLMNNLAAGAFVKFSSIHGTDSSVTLSSLGGVVGDADFSFDIDRRNWIFGAKASMAF